MRWVCILAIIVTRCACNRSKHMIGWSVLIDWSTHFATLSAAIRCPWSADAEEGVGPQPVFVAAFETYRTHIQVALRCFVALLKMLSMFSAISSRGSSKTSSWSRNTSSSPCATFMMMPLFCRFGNSWWRNRGFVCCLYDDDDDGNPASSYWFYASIHFTNIDLKQVFCQMKAKQAANFQQHYKTLYRYLYMKSYSSTYLNFLYESFWHSASVWRSDGRSDRRTHLR